MQPSLSTRSKLTLVASASWSGRVLGSTTASVVITTSIVARPGASIAAPLAIPPTDQPSRTATASLATVSVVMIASAAAVPPSAARFSTRVGIAAVILSIGSRTPIRPVEQTATSIAPTSWPAACRAPATCSAVRCVSAKPSGPVQALAPPEFKITARRRVVDQHLPRPHHRRGLDPVAGEHPGGRLVRSVVEHQGQIRLAAGLQPGGDTAGGEAHGVGDTHWSSSSVSTVWPADSQTSIACPAWATGTRIQSVSKVDCARMEMSASASGAVSPASTPIRE